MYFEKVETFFDRIFNGPEASREFFGRSNWGNGLALPKLVDRDSLPKFGVDGFDRILGVGLLMQELLKVLSIGAQQWLYCGDRGFELRSHCETFKVVTGNHKIFSDDRPSSFHVPTFPNLCQNRITLLNSPF